MIRVIAISIALSGSASAHEWYPLSCCDARDCFRIDRSQVKLVPGGWLVPSGEVIPFDRVRQTPPEGGGDFHICTMDGKPESRTRGFSHPDSHCFYVPDQGS